MTVEKSSKRVRPGKDFDRCSMAVSYTHLGIMDDRKGENKMALLEVQNVKKIYTTRFGGNQVEALKNVSFSVEKGEYVAIMGESGSGKTTLLNILASLDQPTAGEVLLDGKSILGIREKELASFRREHLGFVFQDFNLLDTFTLEDNIYLPLVLAGKDYREMKERLVPIARLLGIDQLLGKYPYEVSGGQKDVYKRQALGYANKSSIPYGIGLIKNKYIGRTFISPEQNERLDKVRIKLSPVKNVINGKRVVLIDDSIVRGTTSKRIVCLLYTSRCV